jgi:hypothetical protein
VKAVPLALCLVWAAPARADTAVPEAAKTWRDGCSVRIDAAAKRLGLQPGARTSTIPLRRENGAKNPLQYVEYGGTNFTVTAGDDSEPRPDAQWARSSRNVDPLVGSSHEDATWFRRLRSRFGKIEGAFSQAAAREFKSALDECLQMGEPK